MFQKRVPKNGKTGTCCGLTNNTGEALRHTISFHAHKFVNNKKIRIFAFENK